MIFRAFACIFMLVAMFPVFSLQFGNSQDLKITTRQNSFLWSSLELYERFKSSVEARCYFALIKRRGFLHNWLGMKTQGNWKEAQNGCVNKVNCCVLTSSSTSILFWKQRLVFHNTTASLLQDSSFIEHRAGKFQGDRGVAGCKATALPAASPVLKMFVNGFRSNWRPELV